jgi:hypothetical protein
MKLSRTIYWLVVVGLAACGGQSREPGTGPRGAAGHVRESDACVAGKAAYQQKRAQVLQRLSSSSCTTDTDCSKLWETNACVSTCGVATPAAGVDAAGQELNAFAQSSCSSCPPIPVPPCVPPQPIQCLEGRCTEDG